MSKKLTTKEFIQKAKEIHGDKYNYSKVEYKHSKQKVCIICPKHGEFWQIPSNHFSNYGCTKCGIIQKSQKLTLTTEEFIQKAKLIHGDKYNYLKVEYKNNNTKVCIICPEHGEFWQNPIHHLKKHGCPKCKNCYVPTTEEFIQKAKEIHGDKYDYSKVEYKHSQQKICIICPEHGEFWQIPNHHLKKHGCPKCVNVYSPTTEEFIQKAKLIHGDKYNYLKVEYKNNNTKVCIICPEHGEFWQTPNSHLNNTGCPKCQRSLGEEAIEKWLKENNILYETQKRFKECRNILPLPFDFYLPNNNICIEFDGEQHFQPIKYWRNNNYFNEIQKHDQIKNEYCQKNNIKLIRISYKKLKKTNNILENIFINTENE